MFFMMGISEGRKELNYHQMIVCDHCGAYGQYRVFMTYTVLSLFFIPGLDVTFDTKWREKNSRFLGGFSLYLHQF